MSERNEAGQFLKGHSGVKTQRLSHYRRDLVEKLNELEYDVIADIVAAIRSDQTPQEWKNRLRIALLGKAVPSFAAIQHVRTGKSEISVKIEAALVQNPAAAALAEQAVFKALGLETNRALLPAPASDTEVIDVEATDVPNNDADQHQSPDQLE